MFTGLIQTTGTVRRIDQRGDRVMAIAMQEPFAAEVGDSIAVSGICLTVIKIDGNMFKASLSAETLGCTTAGSWEVGTRVNLEPSLRVGDTLGGHFVSGHVDGIGRAVAQQKSGDSTVWEFEVTASLGRFIAAKGSVAIDGVSLTVNSVQDGSVMPALGAAAQNVTRFTVNIIPHTAEVTGFATMAVGQAVNIEIDLIARYAARLKETQA